MNPIRCIPDMTTASRTKPETDARRNAMAILADAPRERLETLWQSWAEKPEWSFLRRPETGLVMVRGRAGGSGGPFNLGEVTVTRAVVSLPSGISGYSYCMGRDRKKAELAALFDAIWQDNGSRDKVESDVLAPLKNEHLARSEKIRAETAATKVDFFTMVRGEDE